MKKNDRFGKEWSSDSRDQQYPSDTQATQGLGFLGADAPTTGLHDALWQANDWKDNWLYDQIKTACERYGQSLDLSVGGSRNALADAIRQALLMQNQASESRVGILEIASRDETMKGEDALRAVVPAHLRAVLDDRFSQLGSAARRNEGDFERAGAVNALTASLRDAAWHGFFDTGNADAIAYGSKDAASTGCAAAVRDDARRRVDDLKHSLGTAALANIFDTGEASKIPYGKDAASTGCAAAVRDESRDAIKSVRNDTDARFSQLGNASHARVVDGDYGSTYASLPFEGVGAVASSGLTRNILAKFDSDTSDKIDAVKSSLRSAAFTDLFDTGDADSIPYGKQAASTGCAASVRDFAKGLVDTLKKSLGAAAWKGFFDTGEVSDIPYGYKDAASTGCVATVRDYAKGLVEGLKSKLGAAAFWGVHDNNNPEELRDGETKLVTEGTLKGLRDRLQSAYGVGTFAMARRISGGAIKYNQTTEGKNLVTSSTTGDDGNPTQLQGEWRCLGESHDNRGVTLYVRIA